MPPPPASLTCVLLKLKVVSESRVSWATSMPIPVFLGLFSRLRPDIRDRNTSGRRQTRIIA